MQRKDVIGIIIRSLIGIQRDEATVEYVYCHCDGSPKYVGTLLLNKYNTLDTMRELISLGDISTLKNSIDTTVYYTRDMEESGYVTKAAFVSMERYIKGPAISKEGFRYLLESNGKLMCLDVKNKVYVSVEKLLK